MSLCSTALDRPALISALCLPHLQFGITIYDQKFNLLVTGVIRLTFNPVLSVHWSVITKTFRAMLSILVYISWREVKKNSQSNLNYSPHH